MEETRLWDLVNSAYDRMSPQQKRVWSTVQIAPERWSNSAYGNGYAWVVAIVGKKAVWYNPYEHGFDYSPFKVWGDVGVASGNQFRLDEAVQHILNEVEFGYSTVPRMSGPLPGEYGDL